MNPNEKSLVIKKLMQEEKELKKKRKKYLSEDQPLSKYRQADFF